MRNIRLAGLLVLLASTGARAQSAGAGQIFEIGAGGRGPGMGSAYTAAVRDVSSLYYNPAGMGLLESRQAAFMRANLYGGATMDYLGYAQNRRKGAGGWGVQLVRLSAAGGEGRDALNNSAGGFTYSETGLAFGTGWRGLFLPELSLGAGFKVLTRSLGSSSDRLMGADLGAQYGPLADEHLMLGVVARNAFAMSSGDTDDKLPTSLRAGAAYKIFRPLTVALDVSSVQELRVGMEYDFGFMALRAGYAPEGISFGGGFLFRKAFSLDLAVVNSPALGMSQRLAMGYRFGARKPAKTSSLAGEYLGNGRSELAARNYPKALSSLETSLGMDLAVGGREWKRKAARLRQLLEGMDLSAGSPDDEELKSESVAAALAARGIGRYVDGEFNEAMTLVHVAAGASGRNSVYMRLLTSMAKATGVNITREDIVAPAAFLQARQGRAVEAVRARRYDAAVRSLMDCLLVSADDVLTWTQLGSAYFASGNREKSLEAYRKALQLEPSNVKLRGFVEENFPRSR